VDPRDYQLAVEQARAELADAEASAQAAGVNVPIVSTSTSSDLTAAAADVATARAGIAASMQQAETARAQLAAAEANSSKAHHDVARYKSLVEKQEISQQFYDEAETTARSTAATAEAFRATVRAAEEQVTQAKGRLAQAEANLRSAGTAPQRVAVTRSQAASAVAVVQRKRVALDQALLNLEYTKVVAPIDGVISGRTTEVGQNVQPGQQLMKLISLDDVWVTANFKETQLRHMRPGQKVTVDVDAYGRSYEGHVESIAGASGARFSLLPPENATGNYVKVVQRIPVKILLEPGSNKDHLLRPGMSVVPTVTVR
jgi:membrane fusion protein (multidrug efflux system)